MCCDCCLIDLRTVALVMRKSDSWLTASTSGEDFMIVFTRDCGRHTLRGNRKHAKDIFQALAW